MKKEVYGRLEETTTLEEREMVRKLVADFRVGQRHLDEGVPNCQSKCMLVLAAIDGLKKQGVIAVNTVVEDGVLRFTATGPGYSGRIRPWFYLNRTTHDAIAMYDTEDQRHLVKPFRVRLSNPALHPSKWQDQRPADAVRVKSHTRRPAGEALPEGESEAPISKRAASKIGKPNPMPKTRLGGIGYTQARLQKLVDSAAAQGIVANK